MVAEHFGFVYALVVTKLPKISGKAVECLLRNTAVGPFSFSFIFKVKATFV